MADFPPVQGDAMTGYVENPTVYCATGQMSEPTGSPHVRGVEFRLPRFRQAPVVSLQITAPHGSSMLGIYAVKVNDNVSGQTQVAVEAQTIKGGPAHGEHFCSIVVTGFPL
ncbi:MAG: hypothetical protein H6872_00475 [Methylobacteriaceae bacterium]|nr:hypothetical protein [Methylobacteriaceae bacterium]